MNTHGLRYWTNWRYQLRCALTSALATAALFLYGNHTAWSLACIVLALTFAEMIGQKYRLAYRETDNGPEGAKL